MQTKLLTFKNSKTIKGEKLGYLTGILYLAPAFTSGVVDVCPKASAGCKAACLFTSGRGVYHNVQEARKRKTLLYYNDRKEFMDTLLNDIIIARKIAAKQNLELVIRPNGTADLVQMARTLAIANPDVQFYDYSAIPRVWERILPNYDITFSRKENNEKDCIEALDKGMNVAVVFGTKDKTKLPTKFWGREVISGDNTDLRFLDPKGGKVVGLTMKGKAIHDTTGFVVREW